MRKHSRAIPTVTTQQAEPFETAQELWIWFLKANEARKSGARYTAGLGSVMRPCEPIDILAIMDRLYRNRILTLDHFRVLRHYGERELAPDPNFPTERRAATLWDEAFEHLEPIFEQKKLIESKLSHLAARVQGNFHENRYGF